MKRIGLLVPILSLFLIAGAQAAPLYDNISQPIAGSFGVEPNAGGTLANSFSTGASSYAFSSLTLVLHATNEFDAGSLIISLFDDGGAAGPGAPLAPLGTILDSSLSANPSLVTLSSFGTINLDANTRYWIEIASSMDVTGAPNSSGVWFYEGTDAGVGVPGEFYFAFGSPSPNAPDDGPFLMQINTAAVASVPEPLTLSLFGAGLVGAAMIRRRRETG